MQYKKLSILAALIAVILIFSGCKDHKGNLDEGTITYKITYLTKNNAIVMFLPREMETKFKDNNTITTVESPSHSFFKIAFITDYKKGKKYTLLKIWSLKYYYENDTSDAPFGSSDNCQVKIIKTDSTLMYKDLLCHVAKVYCPTIDVDTFDILYTNDIKVKTPNTNNLYKSLDGVLVKGKLELLGIVMEVDLKEVRPEPVDMEVFSIPQDYKKISRDSMMSILSEYDVN